MNISFVKQQVQLPMHLIINNLRIKTNNFIQETKVVEHETISQLPNFAKNNTRRKILFFEINIPHGEENCKLCLYHNYPLKLYVFYHA